MVGHSSVLSSGSTLLACGVSNCRMLSHCASQYQLISIDIKFISIIKYFLIFFDHWIKKDKKDKILSKMINFPFFMKKCQKKIICLYLFYGLAQTVWVLRSFSLFCGAKVKQLYLKMCAKMNRKKNWRKKYREREKKWVSFPLKFTPICF